MATDSGYHSFSLPRVPYVDCSPETSNSLDLQESSDDHSSGELQAVVDGGSATDHPASSDISTSSQPAIPLLTSTTANKVRSSSKPTLTRKAIVISRVNASTKTSFLVEASLLRRSRVHARVQTSALPRTQFAALTISRDDDGGQDVWSLLKCASLDAALAQHFKIAVNMTEHMNHALFHSEAKHEIKQSVMEEVKAMAEEMIYFFDGLQRSFKVQIEGVKDTYSYLPILGDNVDEHHLDAAIRIWAAKICTYVLIALSFLLSVPGS